MVDRINPLSFRGPYNDRALAALVPLRFAIGYEPRNEVIPERRNVVLGSLAYLDHRVTVPPGTYLWALSGSSQQPEGFTVQITDFAHKTNLFSAPIGFANITGVGGALDAPGNPLHLLPMPRPLVAPAVINVQIHNLSQNVNDVQLVLWMLQPPAAGSPANGYNAALAAEVAIWTKNAHPGAVQMTTSAGSTAAAKAAPALNQPFDIAGNGINAVIAGVAGYSIAIYELALYNTEDQTISLMNGAKVEFGPLPVFAGGSGLVLGQSPEPHFTMDAGAPFGISLEGQRCVGFVKYRMLPGANSAGGASA